MDSTANSIEVNAISIPSKTGKYYVWHSLDAALTWCFGIVMLVAAIPHWENPYYFLGSVYAYKLVDPGLGLFTAMILPLTQLVLAVCFIARIYVNAAHLVAMLLFGVFVAVQSYAYFGGLDISCGCFGPQHSSMIGVPSLLFVGTLFLLAMVRNIISWR